MLFHSNNAHEHCPRCNHEYGNLFRRQVSCAECNRIFCSACFVKIPKCEYLAWGGIYGAKTVMLATGVARSILKGLFLDSAEPERYICPVCYESALADEIADYRKAVAGGFREVELISANYKGEKADYHKDPLEIKTHWRRNKSYVEKVLRVTAATHNRRFVNQISWEQGTKAESSERDGTHYYTVWRAFGIACNM
jgi:hypothetical protein